MDRQLLEAFKTMEELQEKSIIKSYIYDSDEEIRDFTYKVNLEYKGYEEERKRYIFYEDVTKEEILKQISILQEEFEEECEKDIEEWEAYKRDRENDYWYVQGAYDRLGRY